MTMTTVMMMMTTTANRSLMSVGRADPPGPWSFGHFCQSGRWWCMIWFYAGKAITLTISRETEKTEREREASFVKLMITFDDGLWLRPLRDMTKTRSKSSRTVY